MAKIPKKNVFPQDPAIANHPCIFKEEKNIVHLVSPLSLWEGLVHETFVRKSQILSFLDSNG